MKKIIDHFLSGYISGDFSDNTRKSLMINIFGFLGAGLLIFFMALAIYNYAWMSLYILIGFFVILSSIMAYLWLVPARFNQVGILLLALSFSMGMYFLLNPNIDLGPVWQLVFIPMSFMILGHKNAIIYNGLVLISNLGLYIGVSNLHAQYSISFVWRYVLIYFVLTVIMYFYEYIRFSTDHQLKKKQQHLGETLEKLTDQNEEIQLQAELLNQTNIELRKFSLIAENTENSVLILDKQGKLDWVNTAFCKLYGCNAVEFSLKRQNIFDITQGVDIKEVFQKCLEQKKTILYESERVRLNGDILYLQATLTPLLDDFNEVIMFALIETDITRRKQIEKELTTLNHTLELRVSEELQRNREKDHVLLQQNRMAALGELLSNIAHQWRQPLNVVAINIQNLYDAFHYGELDQHYLEEKVEKSMQYINAMSATIEDFRTYFRADTHSSRFCLSQMAGKALSFVEPSLKEFDIEVITKMENNLLVSGFPNQYMQAILCILNNARDSVSHGKTTNPLIKIEVTANSDIKEVRIYNNGPCIEPDVATRIFEPYFSTREEGSGNQGLGLYMAKNIIENNLKGKLTFQNLDVGVEFRISFN
jgi:PAS domain S-box-containing protein